MNNKKTVSTIQKTIKKEIENLLYTKFDMIEDFELKSGSDTFFGLNGLLTPRELTYLAYILETQYNIRFSMEEYDDQRFYSLSGLSEIVAEMVVENHTGKVRI